jgi:hypothetical protein
MCILNISRAAFLYYEGGIEKKVTEAGSQSNIWMLHTHFED